MEEFLGFLILVVWVMGAVIAKGFWMTLFACSFPPYAIYLVVEKVMILVGWA